MERIFVFILLSLLIGAKAPAQTIPNTLLAKEFAAQVKSIDEFICRFNGEESNPQIRQGSDNHRDNIIALFDYQMNHGGLNKTKFKEYIMSFVKCVLADSVRLNIASESFYPIVRCKVIVNGIHKRITLRMRCELFAKDQLRWSIAEVKGLCVPDVIDTTHYYRISPVEHETHFMSLSDILAKDYTKIWGYRSIKTKIDELSVFLALASVGSIKLQMIEDVIFVCSSVPNYKFIIEEKKRTNLNSGWLITKLICEK